MAKRKKYHRVKRHRCPAFIKAIFNARVFALALTVLMIAVVGWFITTRVLECNGIDIPTLRAKCIEYKQQGYQIYIDGSPVEYIPDLHGYDIEFDEQNYRIDFTKKYSLFDKLASSSEDITTTEEES